MVRDDGVRYTAFVYRGGPPLGRLSRPGGPLTRCRAEGAVVPEGVDIAGVRQEILDLQREVAVAAGRISALDSIKPSCVADWHRGTGVPPFLPASLRSSSQRPRLCAFRARKSKDGLREQVERFCTDGSGGQEDPLYAFLLPELRAKAAQATSGRRGRTKTKRASASGAEPQQ